MSETTTGGRCANCGAERVGAFCAVCGQPALPERLTLRGAWRRLLAGATDLDRGLLHTAVALFRDPAGVVGDYARGRTIPYTNPLKYFALALALLQAAALLTGAIGDVAAGMAGDDPERSTRLAELMDRYFVLFAAPAVPVLIVFQAALLGRGRRTVAESLVFALFVCAQQLLVWTVAMPVLGMRKAVLPAAALLLTLAGTGAYYVGAAARYFERTAWSALWRSAVVLVLTLLVYLAVLVAALGALGYRGVDG